MGTEWYVRTENGEVEGPISSRMLKARADGGPMKPETLVRKGADGRWASAGSVKGLFAATATPSPAGSSAPLPPHPPPIATAQQTWAPSSQPWVRPSRNRYLWLAVGITLIAACAIALVMQDSPSTKAVRAAVAEARAWIDAGSLADSARIEQQLLSAKANAAARDAPTLETMSADFQRVKGERLAASFQAAKDAIARKELDKARCCLRECQSYGRGTEFLDKATVLNNQLNEADSEPLAMEKLVAMKDDEFARFQHAGTCRDEGTTDPALQEIRNATFRRCYAKAAEKRAAKKAELAGHNPGNKVPPKQPPHETERDKRLRLICEAHRQRDAKGRLQAAANGIQGDWRDAYQQHVEQCLFAKQHDQARDSELAHYVLEVPEGYEVVSKLAELHRSGRLKPHYIQKVLEEKTTLSVESSPLVITRTGLEYAEQFVQHWGNYLVAGGGGDYTAGWILEEAKTRAKEGDVGPD